MISDEGVLYIEPSAATSSEPVVDRLTRKMAAAFRQATEGTLWCDCHVCACGVMSDSCDFVLPNGEVTNSLAVHYLAYHRVEVSKEQIAKVEALTSGEVEPIVKELSPPRRGKRG